MMRQTTTDNATRVYAHNVAMIWPQSADMPWLEGMLAAIPDDVLLAEVTRRGIVWKR